MTDDYDDGNIRVLEGLEAVRLRPGMYIGSTGAKGLHHLVYEVVDNSIEEAIAGHCQNIDISLNADGSVTVADDGRGMPTGVNPQTGKSAIETLLTVLFACSCHHRGYKIAGSLHGIGVSVVNALSSQLEVRVWQDRKIHTQRFQQGKAVSDLEIVPSEGNRMGTMVTFLPDADIFKESIEFDFELLAARLRELAFLNPGLRFSLTDYRRNDEPTVERYCYLDGVSDYVAHLNADEQALSEAVIYLSGERNRVKIQAALQWCDREEDCLLGFVNTVRTVDGGTHLEGLKLAVTRTLNHIAHHQELIRDGNLDGKYIGEGLTAIISILHPCPEFEGATRTKLANAEVREMVNEIVSAALDKYFTQHPDVAEIIVKQAIGAAMTDELRQKEGALQHHRLERDRF
jgi:DNA gyrase subunit B